jgi:hypothetical protein
MHSGVAALFGQATSVQQVVEHSSLSHSR